MTNHTYVFTELRPYPNVELYVYGEAEMTYRYYPAERDVGIMEGGYEFDIHSIKLHSSNAKKYPNMELKPESELYQAILDALTEPDYARIVSGDIEESMRPLY